MFGWEFPPFFAGGVGTVCYELTKQLAEDGVEVQYVMPFCPDNLNPEFLKIYNASKNAPNIKLSKSIKVTKVNSILSAYQTEKEYKETLEKLTFKSSTLGNNKNNTSKLYGEDMFLEIELFAKRVEKMFLDGLFDDFDVIHAHDWTTIPAALVLKKLSGKPLAVHVHITEFNKTGNNTANPDIYKIEKEGFEKSDKVIAISNLIKETVKQYGISENKIEIIHNGGIKMNPRKDADKIWLMGENYSETAKVVMFAGRITGMKGPLRFVDMANLVLKQQPDTYFVMAGTGDQLNQCIEKAKELKIDNKFHFFGFYTREEAEKLYDLADVFVLPSQLEPFGVTPLEAMIKKTPVVLSKQSGVAEVVKHVLINDFWDVEKMASNVVSLLAYPLLHKTIKEEAFKEAEKIDWKKPAKECENLYERMLS
ncbi:MAG: glycosyltransferase family 4 protein [Candidatus Woesearchaeota archaeon]